MNPGIYPDLSDNDYHNLPYISSTMIREAYLKSPAAVEKYYEQEGSSHTNYSNGSGLNPMGLGGAFHGLVLNNFGDWDLVEKVGKTSEKKLINPKDWETLRAMERSLILNNSYWNAARETGKTELTVIWNCRITGLLAKAKFDLIHPRLGIWDLKTTSKEMNQRNLQWLIQDRAYDLQAAHYIEAAKFAFPDYAHDFTFTFIETNAPWRSQNAEFCAEKFTDTQVAYEYTVKAIANAKASNYWPTVSTVPFEIQPFSRELPKWRIL